MFDLNKDIILQIAMMSYNEQQLPLFFDFLIYKSQEENISVNAVIKDVNKFNKYSRGTQEG